MRFRRRHILLALLAATPTLGQQTQPSLTPEQLAELDRARTIITDLNASAEVRRFGAEDLFRLGYPAATDLAIEILCGEADPSPRVAVCQAVTTGITENSWSTWPFSA